MTVRETRLASQKESTPAPNRFATVTNKRGESDSMERGTLCCARHDLHLP